MSTSDDSRTAGHGFRSEPARARVVGFRPIGVAELEQFELEGRLVDLYRSGVGLTTAADAASVGGSMSEGPQSSYPTMPDRELAEPRGASPAEIELAKLHDAIDGYAKWIDTLEHRLRNGLVPDVPHEIEAAKVENVTIDRSSLTSSIEQCGETVQLLNRRLARLVDRIDV